MAVMLHGDPTHIFTIDEFVARLTKVKPDQPEYVKTWDFLKTIKDRRLQPKRNTVLIYLKRFGLKGIAERVNLPNDVVGYRCASTHKALAYIEGRSEEYIENLTPQAPSQYDSTDIVHRLNYRLRLPKGSYEVAKKLGEYRKNGSTPAFYQIDKPSFRLMVYPPNGNSVIFLKGDWRKDIQVLFGKEMVKLMSKEIDKGGHIGIAKDLPWKELYDRPIQLINEKGQVALYRVARSQKKEGEVDIHRYENDDMAKQFEQWWDDKHFKADMLTALKRQQAFQDRVFQTLELYGKEFGLLETNQVQVSENLLKLSQSQRQLVDSLNGFLNGKKPESQPYQAPSEDKADYSNIYR